MTLASLNITVFSQDSFDKSDDPIHVVNVCIKCDDMSLADQGKQIVKFQEILQSRVSIYLTNKSD